MAAANQSPGLTDTDLLIDAARGVPQGVAYLTARQAAGVLQISAVSAMELVAGCRDSVELARVQQFLDAVTVLPVTEAISRAAFGLMVSFRLSHGMLLPDALIAATAQAHGLALHTKNVRHFQMIPGLALDRPY